MARWRTSRPDSTTYIDATLGWVYDSHAALRSVFEQYMPNWGPPARSYATRVLAIDASALVHMVDTPELFGGELRILAAIDLDDGRIVRWVDYWDASGFDPALYAQFRTPEELFPNDLREVGTRAAPELVTAATAFQAALAAGDAALPRRYCTPTSCSWTWPCAPTCSGGLGRRGYLGRVLDDRAVRPVSTLRHIVGGAHGGGFEWTSATAHERPDRHRARCRRADHVGHDRLRLAPAGAGRQSRPRRRIRTRPRKEPPMTLDEALLTLARSGLPAPAARRPTSHRRRSPTRPGSSTRCSRPAASRCRCT